MRSPALVLVATAVLVLAACGSEQRSDRATSTARAAPAATPFPSIDRADLVAGRTYTTRLFRPSITLTLPEGEWLATGADSANHIEIEPAAVKDPVDHATLAFHHMTRVFDPARGGKVAGDAVPGPADFAAWLTHHPHLRTTKPRPVEALGLKGVSIDVRVKSSQPRRYKDCGKVGGECVVMFISSIEPIVYGSRSFGRFYVLQQPDGKQLVVEQAVEPASAFKAQKPAFDAVLKSATTAG
jgi:hypothetical protein